MAIKLRATYDLAVIGGGIIGLGTARQISMRHPKLKICVLEKEKQLASHQSRRNSGVVHTGIYYKKGTMKSKFCIKGARMIRDYCQSKGLPYNRCGKLIVATQNEHLEGLHKLFEGAKRNNINDIEMFLPEQVQKVQPECKNALEAIWSPNTAIVDWEKIALSYADDFKKNGGEIINEFVAYRLLPAKNEMIHIQDVITDDSIEVKSIINCAGVYSDFLARLTGNNEHPKVVPFKGSYFVLSDRIATSLRTNIYPVPDPNFPFLGVHLTPRVDGSAIVGPTALLVSSMERYGPTDEIKLSHMYHIFIKSGLFKMLKKKQSMKAGFYELWRHYSKKRFAREVSQLMPGITTDDLIDTNFSGIRAQVIDKDGTMVDDFIFERGYMPQFRHVLHVRNCPSPAATSSLPLTERIANIYDEQILDRQ